MACLANIASACIFDEIAPCSDSADSVDIGATIVGGTAGSVLFVGAGGVLAQDNANFYWDDTANTLGIGGTASTMRLYLEGSTENLSQIRINFAAQSQQYGIGATDGVGNMFVGAITNCALHFRTNNTSRASFTAIGNYALTPGVSTSGAVTAFKVTAPANTAQTASTEAIDFHIDLSRTNQWATGTLAVQRMSLFDVNATLGFVGASTAGAVIGLHVTAPPTQGTNATFENVIGVYIGADGAAAAATTTISSAAASRFHMMEFSGHTVAFSGSTNITGTDAAVGMLWVPILAVTFSNTLASAASVYIEGATSISGGGTITANYSLWVDGGLVRLDSSTANGTVATLLGSVGPTGANTTVQEWLTININGTTRYLPCF